MPHELGVALRVAACDIDALEVGDPLFIEVVDPLFIEVVDGVIVVDDVALCVSVTAPLRELVDEQLTVAFVVALDDGDGLTLRLRVLTAEAVGTTLEEGEEDGEASPVSVNEGSALRVDECVADGEGVGEGVTADDSDVEDDLVLEWEVCALAVACADLDVVTVADSCVEAVGEMLCEGEALSHADNVLVGVGESGVS